MLEMSYKKYDEMVEDFENMKFKAGSWWPSVQEIKTHLEPHIRAQMDFAVWILETADDPKTEEEIEAKKYLKKIVYRNLYLKDIKEESDA